MYLVIAQFDDGIYMLFVVKASYASQARNKVRRFIQMEEWSGLETITSKKIPSFLQHDEVERIATIV